MKIHDLTHLIKYTHTPLPTRLCIGHYGDGYMLPKYCILSKMTINDITYGVFKHQHPIDQKNNKVLTITYSADEPDAYAKFINKLRDCSKFCDIDNLILSEKGKHGEVSESIYKKIGLPQIKGVCLSINRQIAYNVRTNAPGCRIGTSIGITLSRDEIIKKIKEHLDKLPQEWKDKRHIPEIYLK